MTTSMLEKLARFQRPENSLPFARDLTPQTLAGLFGAKEAEYRTTIAGLDRQLAEAAAHIATSTKMLSYLQAVPFKPNAHIVAIGESTTADRLSWFEILRTLLEAHRPDLKVRLTNLASSGATTTQVLATLPAIRRLAPDWVFCMLGTNDSQRLDGPDGPLLVRPEETKRNLYELRTRALPDNAGTWVWLTPTPIDEARIASFPFFASAGISWSNEQLVDLARSLPSGNDLVIDSSRAVVADAPEALADDGLHPGPAAQEALTTEVLEALVKQGR